jgi:hypothetical protein
MSSVVRLINSFKTEFSKILEEIGNKKGEENVEIRLINENKLPSSEDIKVMEEILINYLARENWHISNFKINTDLSMFVVIKFKVLL